MMAAATSQLMLQLSTQLLDICSQMCVDEATPLQLQASVNETDGKVCIEKNPTSFSMKIQACTSSILEILQDGWQCSVSSVAMETKTAITGPKSSSEPLLFKLVFQTIEDSSTNAPQTDIHNMAQDVHVCENKDKSCVCGSLKKHTHSEETNSDHSDEQKIIDSPGIDVDNITQEPSDFNEGPNQQRPMVGKKRKHNDTDENLPCYNGQSSVSERKKLLPITPKSKSKQDKHKMSAPNGKVRRKVCNNKLSHHQNNKNMKTGHPSCHADSGNGEYGKESRGKTDEAAESNVSKLCQGLPETVKTMCKICQHKFKTSAKRSCITHCGRVHGITFTEYEALDNMSMKEREQFLKEKIEILKKRHTIYETCPECKKTFGTFVRFAKHVRTCHAEKKDLLLSVEKELSSSNTSTIHMPCPLCSEVRNGKGIFRHFKEMHADIPEFENLLSGLQAEYQQKFRQDKKERYKALSLKASACKYCDKVIEKRWTRMRHEDKCQLNPNPVKVYRCRRCSYATKNQQLLELHMKKHEEGKRAYVCEICGASYLNSSGLYSHKRKVHLVAGAKGNATVYQCPVCNKILWDKTSYEQHYKRHTGIHDQICDHCGKAFTTDKDVQKHINAVHLNRYKFRCDKCGHGMARLCYLKKHKCGRVRRIQNEDGGTAVVKKIESSGAKGRKTAKVEKSAAVQGQDHIENLGQQVNLAPLQGQTPALTSMPGMAEDVISKADVLGDMCIGAAGVLAQSGGNFPALDFNLPMVPQQSFLQQPSTQQHQLPQHHQLQQQQQQQEPQAQGIFLQGSASQGPLPSLQSSYLNMSSHGGLPQQQQPPMQTYHGLLSYSTATLDHTDVQHTPNH